MCEAVQRPGTAGGGSQGGECVLEIACRGSYTSVGASLGTGSGGVVRRMPGCRSHGKCVLQTDGPGSGKRAPKHGGTEARTLI